MYNKVRIGTVILLLLFIYHSINPKGGYRICHNKYKYKYNTRNKISMLTLNENINKRDIIKWNYKNLRKSMIIKQL
jgi:hypothetical protein